METITCSMCGICKNKEDFTPDIKKKRGTVRFYRCKECVSKKSRKYRQTIDGVISTALSRQKQYSKVRRMPPPEYTKQEFVAYLKNNLYFIAIYKGWVASGYDKWLKPSIDRIDDFLPYSFGNIMVVTWKDNFQKQKEDMKHATGTSGLYCKAIFQHTLSGEFVAEFVSIRYAERQTGILGISECLRGSNKTAGGYKWEYKKDREKELLMQSRIPQKTMQKNLKTGRKPIDVSVFQDVSNYNENRP